MGERIAVAGAGMAGLATVLALACEGRTITVYDRDPPPPDISADAAFYDWERKGVTQLRHSHVFLGRLYTLIRDRYPALYDALKTAGTRTFTMEQGLPFPLQGQYRPAPGDEDFTFLFSRRTTLEFVIRRYVEALPGISFVTNVGVRGLCLETRDGQVRATGLMISRDGSEQTVEADIVIDACGRMSPFPDWLKEAGVVIREETSPAGILYFTRHYRFLPGAREPERTAIPGAGDLGYLKYGIFNADNRHFSITLAVPEIELQLRTAIVKPEVFDAVCGELPAVKPWLEPERSEAVSRVFSMGNLHNVWRHFLSEQGTALVENFFAVGDSANRTNPLYGRGCSSAFVGAECLAEALSVSSNPQGRARAYDAALTREVRAYWNAMVRQDQAAIRRAQNEQNPYHQPSLKGRIVKSFLDDAVGPATRGNLHVFRALIKSFHMMDAPAAWLMKPSIVARVLAMWARPRSGKAHLMVPKLGPERRDMLNALGLTHAA